MSKREFTGVFIPSQIWESKELIPAEKMILGEIDCLSRKTGYCDASRQHFADWLCCTVQNVTYYFEKLERLGFIQVEKKPGFRNKIRLVNDRFYQTGGVNGTDGGGKRDLRGGVNGTDGGGKRDLPEIQDKYKYKDKGEIKHAPAKSEFTSFEEGKNEERQVAAGVVAAALPFTDRELQAAEAENAEVWRKISLSVKPTPSECPLPQTPKELCDSLLRYANAYPENWRDGVLEHGRARDWPESKVLDCLMDFCSYQFKSDNIRAKYSQYTADFSRWLKRQPRFDNQTSFAGQQSPLVVSSSMPPGTRT